MSQNMTQAQKKSMTQETINFVVSSTLIVQSLDEYNLSVKREFRTLRAMKLIDYTPETPLSDQYIFQCVKGKTTYQRLRKEFEKAIEKVETPENTDSEIYKVKELLRSVHGKTV